MEIIVLVFLLVNLLLSVNASDFTNSRDFYSSTVSNAELKQTHKQLQTVIRMYAEAVATTAYNLNRYLDSPHSKSVSEKWETDGDPLRTYHLIKRTSKDIDDIVGYIRHLRSLDPLLEIENFRAQGRLPSVNDFKGVSRALLRLQRMYHIPPDKLVSGQYREGLKDTVKLSPHDCMVLGQTAEEQHEIGENDGFLQDARLWYETGLNSITDDPSDADIRSILNTHLSRLTQEIVPSTNLTEREEDTLHIGKTLAVINESLTDEEVERLYRRLCRGEKIRVPSMDVNCSCHLSRGPHPYLKLNPLKVEILSSDPYLVIIHDIIGEKEIEELKEAATPIMTRSGHIGENESIKESEVRVSSTSWLGDDVVQGLTKRLEAFLGMSTNIPLLHAEDYQVLNYGVGGHYEIHQDYFDDQYHDVYFNTSGDRLATLMIYLSDVESGGATAFPYIGIRIPPKKGAAAFWWNLRSDCRVDILTTHGACPVLYGTKWVSNKWFRLYPQMFRIPCRKDQNVTMRHI